MKKIYILFGFLFTLYAAGCADKLNLDAIESLKGDTNITGDTVYVHLSPDWEGFNHPQAIIVGNEPFIYVADTDNNRIVMLNVAGTVLGTRTVKKPVAIAQDYKLNLIVCAQFDTTLSTGETKTFSAVYKYDMVSAGHHIESAPVTRLLPRASDLNNTDRTYTGVTAFYDNTFYVTRKGPSNSSTIDPDNSILYFSPKSLLVSGATGDTLLGRIGNIDPIGTGLVSAYGLSSIHSFNKKNNDIIITLIGNNYFKAQWLTFVETTEKSAYESKLTASESAFMTVNKFTQPQGSTLDNYNNIFIADAAKDSIYKFNSQGEELQSFGGPKVFKSPYGIAFYDKTIYVVDAGANKILRFSLSTEIK
jgi:hypothetical protein